MTTYQASPGGWGGYRVEPGKSRGERVGRGGETDRWAGQEGPATPTPGPRNVPTLTKKKRKKEIARVTFFPLKSLLKTRIGPRAVGRK